MDWMNFTLQGAIVAGGVYVLRSCFAAIIKRDTQLAIESFKHDCSSKLEATKHDLSRILERDKIAFGGIYARRLETLGRLYQLLSRTLLHSQAIVQTMWLGTLPSEDELQQALATSLNELEQHIEEHCVYWPEGLERKARDLDKGCLWGVQDYLAAKHRQDVAHERGDIDPSKYYDSEDKARDAVQSDLRDLMMEIKGMIRVALEVDAREPAEEQKGQ